MSRSSEWELWMRQIGSVLRLELKKTFLSKRGSWIYLLALAPVGLTFLHWLRESSLPLQSRHSLGDCSRQFAILFQLYYLRLGIFFACVGIFSNLFRSEALEKTLHYYFLTPLRREVLVTGKFLAGLAVALVVFGGSVAASFLLIGQQFGGVYSDYIFHGPGLAQLSSYLAVTALACAGYGAVFLTAGLRYRNPMIPAAVVWVWENLNPFLPGLLKQISIIFYLKALSPVEIPVPPPFNIMVIDIDPPPAWLAITGLVAVAALILTYAAISARRAEIDYSE
jgi:hypothetical protein